ncbi:MAG: NHL repeat protein [Lentisphaerae bacterium ADurb.BinA184]|nr:MAG: NHL repeat protein [Lentisphaerae bacterium ADurb.BinA184]
MMVVSGTQVLRIAGGAAAPLVTAGLERPVDMAVDGEGRLLVTDRGTHQVKVFGKDGVFSHAIGAKGGRPQPGAWVAGALRNPRGVAVDVQGRVWVVEEDMWPKRVSVWTVDGQLVRDFIGPATYGGMGAAADPADKTRLFGIGCEFRLDYEANQASVVANVLAGNLVGDLVKFGGREYFMVKRNELYLRRGDALVPVARFGQVRVQDLAESGLPVTPPEGARDAFTYLWSDGNDDGAMQAEEFATSAKHGLDTGYWGGYWLDESFNLVSAPGGYGRQTVSLVPLKGFTTGGAPIWDVAGQRLVADRESPGPNKLFLAADGLIIVGSPLAALAADGTVRWTYADKWADVHGSHRAPIPERDDQLVGTLSCIGTAKTPFGKVFALNSNMGRLFLFTTDGLFVASVFQDCRIGPDSWPAEMKRGAPLGGVTMGGEWFGGYFFQSEPTGEYYLIAGGTSYNLIRLDGMATVKPLPATAFAYTAEQFAAAEKLQQRRAAAATASKTLAVARLAGPVKIDGNLDEYAPERFVEWSAGPYKARGAVATDGASLYLAYDVAGDANPMVNGGQDVNQLFITGDAVDLQLGTDPAADPQRTDPVPGDLRLLISVLDGQPVAVLYRWRSGGEKKPQTFSSPWRKVTLDWVGALAGAQVHIVRRGGGYTVEAAVPLAELGFAPQPGKAYKLDLGVIFSDATGTNRAARVYWSNQATGLVNDVPGEIMATPSLWGTAQLQE